MTFDGERDELSSYGARSGGVAQSYHLPALSKDDQESVNKVKLGERL